GGPPDNPTTWRPPPGLSAGQPLVQLADVAGVWVKGLRLDGRGRGGDLGVLAGRCPRLALEGLRLPGYPGPGIQLGARPGGGGPAGRPAAGAPHAREGGRPRLALPDRP